MALINEIAHLVWVWDSLGPVWVPGL